MNRRVLITGLALAVFGLASWWWLGQQREAPADAERPRRPDAFFRQLDALRHDESGRPVMRVLAAHAEHYPDDSWIYLREVKARSEQADARPWRLSADAGRLSDDGARLDAQGNVLLVRENDGGAPLTLAAEQLSVDSEAKLATSESVVVISQGPSRIRGRGLRASLADDHIWLENEVEAWFEK